ncbi:hypothetical protein COT48_00750 [Candidatus Woesearchaeota archaeon CG08_land_8_20_14_0_20_47_9]|nr:MAG: hypothetical protein AUJ69_02545 [Candidatus Woesearchaeota archaeon CG1_02_47_18]PIO04376.1 MAG: hypothetical protein COT48_00750 [Candidatus Woesearchaeota archaeon CG08_land_8_20_14_0_20_47_9]HII29823.1 hypothetical protein [Candidatus Woesearchaeota archaeon]
MARRRIIIKKRGTARRRTDTDVELLRRLDAQYGRGLHDPFIILLIIIIAAITMSTVIIMKNPKGLVEGGSMAGSAYCRPVPVKHNYCMWANRRCVINPREYALCSGSVTASCNSALTVEECIGEDTDLYCYSLEGC